MEKKQGFFVCFYYGSSQALIQVAQKGYGVSITGDSKNLMTGFWENYCG